LKKYILTIVVLISVAYLSGCGGTGFRAPEDAHVLFESAQKDYDKGKYLNAIEKFQLLVYNFPGATLVDTAQYYLAMSYYGDKDYELAAVEFSRLKNSYPQSDYADNAQFMAGVCYFENSPKQSGLDQEDLKRSIVALGDFILDNPDSPLISDAEMVIVKARTKLAKKGYDNGLVYMKILDYRAAKIYLQYVIDEFIETEYAPLALFKLAEIDYKKDDFKSASERFNQFMNIYAEHELISDARKYLEKISPMMVDTVDAPDESE